MTSRPAPAHAHTPRTPRTAPARPRGVLGRAFTAVGAALAFAALLVGLPALLALVVGNPLPSTAPTWAALHRALTRPLTDRTVIDVLAVIAWCVWATLVIGVVRESVAQLRGLPAPHVPRAFAPQQALARHLVASVLMIVPSLSAAHASSMPTLTRAHHTVTMTVATSHSGATARDPSTGRDGTRVVTRPGTHTGRPATAADGVGSGQSSPAHTDPAGLTRGAPASHEPRKFYVVQPPHGAHYDSLWDIAARHLGDGLRYPEIYALNRDRPQAGGGQLTHASLIQPGWVLFLPADAVGPGVHDVRDLDAASPGHDTTLSAGTGDAGSIGGVSAGTARTATPVHDDGHPSGRRPTLHHSPRPAEAVTPEPANGHLPDGNRPDTHDRSAVTDDHHKIPRNVQHDGQRGSTNVPALPLELGLGLGSLAVLAALARARRRAMRRRPRGTRLAPAPARLRTVEARLRADAARERPVAAAVRLAIALAGRHEHALALRGVLHHANGDVDLLLDPPVDTTPAATPIPTSTTTSAATLAATHGVPPAPFRAITDGWRLIADDSDYAFALGGTADARPALLELGSLTLATPGDGTSSQVRAFADLAALGRVAIDGPDAQVGDYLAVLAARLVGAPWASAVRVVVPPDLGARIGSLPHIETLDALGPHTADLLRRARRPLSASAENNLLTGQQLVLLGWAAAELPEQLTDATRDARYAIAALTRGPDPHAGQHWTLADGQLLGAPTPGPVVVTGTRTAGRTDHEVATTELRVSEQTSDGDTAADTAADAGADPVSRDLGATSDDAVALLLHVETAAFLSADDPAFSEIRADAPPEELERPAMIREPDVRDDDVRDDDVREADVREADVREADVREADVRDDDTGAEPRAEATDEPTGEATATAAELALPELVDVEPDERSTRPSEQDPPEQDPSAVPMSIDVLGPLELTGIETPRRTPAVQTLVYLALHRRGATAETLTAALWPDGMPAVQSMRNRVAEARQAVRGAITDGPDWRLEPSVGCDWQRFQALAKSTPADRLAALDLVRGEPFAGTFDDWIDFEQFRADMIARIIDLAAEVAEASLRADEPAQAYRAARAGLRASPYEHRLYRLAMHAAHAEGSTGKLHALMTERNRLLDIAAEEDAEARRETIEIYEELSSSDRPRPRG